MITEADFWKRVDASGDCWLWTGWQSTNGYGMFQPTGARIRRAHRHAYETLVGPIGDRQLDHLCRVRLCVNPDHLEPVTQQENIRRGYGPTAANARKTHCTRGHNNWRMDASGGRHCADCSRRSGQGPIVAVTSSPSGTVANVGP